MDVTNDGCVERPEVGDPTAVPSCLDRTADWAPYPQATKQQVVRSVITHELGHAVGVSIHTSTDAGDIMLDYSTNWTRDDHFSADAAPMISIHNKGLR
jgi:predicted Zn-dependent protease